MEGSWTFVSINSRLESNKEEGRRGSAFHSEECEGIVGAGFSECYVTKFASRQTLK